MILATDGTNFPGAKHAGHRTPADGIRDASGVVIGLTEQAMTTTVAGKHQRSIGIDDPQQRLEVLRCGLGVSNMELQRGADRSPVPNSDGTHTMVGSENASHEEVTPPKLAGRLIDDDPDMESASHECLGFLIGVVHEFAQPLKRGTHPESADEVRFAVGHDVRLTDRPTTLRHHGEFTEACRQEDADGAIGVQLAIEDQSVRARTTIGRCDPTNDA